MTKRQRHGVTAAYTAAVCIAALYIGQGDKSGAGFVAAVSLCAVLLFPVLRRVCAVPQGRWMETLWLWFAFFGYTLGTGCVLYARLPYYDLLMHGISGVLTTLTGFCLYTRLRPAHRRGEAEEVPVATAVAFLFAQTAAVCWELAEYTGFLITGHDAQNVLLTGVGDTMQDMLISLAVSAVVCLLYAWKKRGHRVALFFPLDEWRRAVQAEKEEA